MREPSLFDVNQSGGRHGIDYSGPKEKLPVSDTVAVFRGARPHIRRISIDGPWAWLAAGWKDLRAAPGIAVIYGSVPVIAGVFAGLLLLWFDLPYLVWPLGAGFFFLGPFVATGLYDVSRRLEVRHFADLETTFLAWRRNPDQIALMGAVLLLLHLAWMRLAQLIFAIFAWRTVPSWDRFVDLAWFSIHGLPFLAAGIACGAVLAALAFSIGAFSMPYLLDQREANLFEAIATSVAAVRINIKPMALWAMLIVILVGLAMVCGLLGLVIVLPLIAHATWHAYRDVVRFDAQGI